MLTNTNSDLEGLILAYVFFYIKHEYFVHITEIINEHHFYFIENKTVFLALKEALKQNMPLHPKTIKYLLKPADFAHLANPEESKKSGLEIYFDDIMSNVELGVFHLDIEKLCLKLKDLFLRRNLEACTKKAISLMNNPVISTSEILRQIENDIVNIGSQDHSKSEPEKIKTIFDNTFAKLKKVHESEDSGIDWDSGVPTGFRSLDNVLTGFKNSDLIIAGGRTSMGKTAFAINVILQVAKKQQEKQMLQKVLQKEGERDLQDSSCSHILFFSLEMSSNQIAERLIATELDVNLFFMTKGKLNNSDFIRIEEYLSGTNAISDLGIYVDTSSAPRLEDIRRISNKIAIQHGLSLIVIDYLQLIKPEKGYGISREREIGGIVAGLKSLAKDLNVPVIALSQLSRATESRESKRPFLSDLRDSGSIEQDADIVLLLYREEYYLHQQKPKDADIDPCSDWHRKMDACKNQIDVIIAKHRNGAVGTVKMGFHKESMKFFDVKDG